MNSKHEAEVEALRARGPGPRRRLVNPTFVLGPDDPSGTSMGLVRRFLLRQIPAYVDGGLNIVDVRDVAAGHLLADEKGTTGERYILGGRNFTLQRLFADLARISGVPAPPAMKLPAPRARSAGSSARLARSAARRSPPTRCARGRSGGPTARRRRSSELGFKARPHEETLEDAVRWQLRRLGDRAARGRQPTPR